LVNVGLAEANVTDTGNKLAVVSQVWYLKLFSDLYINSADLCLTCLHTRTQRSSRRTGKMWSCHRAPGASHTTAFCTDYKHCRRLSAMPYSTE